MATLPSAASLTGTTTTNAQQKTNFTNLRDFLADLLGTDSADKSAARATLGVGIRSYLAGLTMSTAGSSTTMTVAAGEATNSTNSHVMMLAASRAKTTAAWAVGTAVGGLDTGTIANNTWYHFYLIKRIDTDVEDVVFSTNATTPTLPTNYTLYRGIGKGKTNGSGQWTAFVQDGDYFQWLDSVNDVSATNPGTAAVNRTLSVPTGANVVAHIQVAVTNTGSGGNVFSLFTDPAISDIAAASGASDTSIATNAAGGSINCVANLRVRTNTSGQIRSRISYSDANVAIRINTLGWFDRRGRDA